MSNTVKFYPQMTSDTSPYISTASSSYDSTSLPFKAFDGKTNTEWSSKTIAGWLQIDFLEKKKMSNMYIQGYNTARYSPRNFTIQVSNNDTDWEIAYTGTNVTWNDNEVKMFPIELAESGYRYYKVNITSNNGGLYSIITDIYFDEVLPQNKSFILNEGEYKKYIPSSPAALGDNFIPIMINNTSPSPYVAMSSPSYGGYNAFNAFNRVFDGTSRWISVDPLPVWVGIDLSAPKKVYSYQLCSGNLTQQVKSWILQGSNDNTTWIDLDTVTNNPLPIDKYDKLFKIDSPDFYRYYRVYITELVSGTATSISGFTLLDMDKPRIFSEWKIIASTTPTKNQFLESGMDSLSPLIDRKVTALEPNAMIDSSEILNGEEGKVFSRAIDLKKYFDIKQAKVEVK